MNGELFLYRYRILERLGRGIFHETYLAEDIEVPERRCIIKKFKPTTKIYATHDYKLFEREIVVLAKLSGNSSQIPSIYAHFKIGEDFYLVEEFIQGHTLTQVLLQHGLMSESSVIATLVDILSVLSYVHSQGIIHRNINPDNIIIRNSDKKIVLINFGTVSRIISNLPVSKDKIRGFVPIEQLNGKPQISSDIYSLGLTIIYLLTGKTPQLFDTDPNTGAIIWHPHTLSISKTTARVLNKAIQPIALDRYYSAVEMLQDLEEPIEPNLTIANSALKTSRLKTIFLVILVIIDVIGIFQLFPALFVLAFVLISVLTSVLLYSILFFGDVIQFGELFSKLWLKGKYIIAYASGGAFLGGLTSNLIISIIFALIGAIYGLFTNPNHSPTNQTSSSTNPLNDRFIKRCENAIALLSGGALVGGIIGQVPGSIVGAFIAATFGFINKV